MCSTSYGRVLKKILSSRRIRESNWHWGLEAPNQARGLAAAQPLSGVQGQFRAEKCSAQASAHPLSQSQGGLFWCWLCLFVAEVLSEMHEVWTFAACEAFLFDMFAFFSSLENYFGFRTTNIKGKTDHSVSLTWNKRFWTFLTRRVFFWLCIRLIYELILPGWIKKKAACILLLVVTVTFFTCLDLLPLQNQLYLCLQSKNHIAVITHQSEQTCALIKLSRK